MQYAKLDPAQLKRIEQSFERTLADNRKQVTEIGAAIDRKLSDLESRIRILELIAAAAVPELPAVL